ncbi:antitoxin ParD1/3/4 [Rhizobium aquaticum]|uniref:Antitoxin ParD1/3/4 n=1 Tax=Rhizobium aquaticum TaxID=1549636 RepID=A0ABV2IZK0_9HYPH
MARAKTFSLGDTYDGMIADLVKSGRFSTETEVVRAGIRMLADYEAEMRKLREQIGAADGEIADGKGIEFTGADDLLRTVMQHRHDS